MTDDDISNLFYYYNKPHDSSVIPFANGLGQAGAGAGSSWLAPPPLSDMNLDAGAMLSLMDAGVGSSVIADMLPQLDTGSPARAESLAYPTNAQRPWLDSLSADTSMDPYPSLLGGNGVINGSGLSPGNPSSLESYDLGAQQSTPREMSSPTGDPRGPAQPDRKPGDPKVTSDAGRQFIQTWEGYNDQIYPDAAGNGTFGYGHKLTNADGNLADTLAGMSNDQKRSLANAMFDVDVKNHEQALYRQLGADAINALTQNQFDALVAASYNGGVGPKMIGDIQKGDDGAAAGEFNANYITKNVNGVKTRVLVPGLQKRNAAEQKMFVNGDYNGKP